MLLALVIAAVGIIRLDLIGEPIRELTLPLRHDDIIRQQARDKNVDADLIAAVIFAESRFRDQTSSAGARGLMQITPDTADLIERLSGGETFVTDDLSDPDINIRYGTFYLRHLLDRYGGNEVAALAAYNAGQSNADKWGGAQLGLDQIGFRETRAYVKQVRKKRREYRKGYGNELGVE
ncbi:MAG: lytic transglycosylase domain-containing protein [Solirubrobacterales bacterium]